MQYVNSAYLGWGNFCFEKWNSIHVRIIDFATSCLSGIRQMGAESVFSTECSINCRFFTLLDMLYISVSFFSNQDSIIINNILDQLIDSDTKTI